MIDFFKKCHKKFFYKDPVEHIIWVHPISVKEYDDLYEEQNSFDGKLWSEFKEKHKLKYNYSDIRFTKVLTKYSTEYNNQLFIQELCFKLNMDKKYYKMIKNGRKVKKNKCKYKIGIIG